MKIAILSQRAEKLLPFRSAEIDKFDFSFFGKDKPLNKFYILIETMGSNLEHDQAKIEQLITYCLNDQSITDGILSLDSNQSKNIWKVRESITPALQMDGYVYKHDISLPLENYYETVNYAWKACGSYAKRIVGFGHLADGNVHLNVTCPQRCLEIEKRLYPHLYGWVNEMGGNKKSVDTTKLASNVLGLYSDKANISSGSSRVARSPRRKSPCGSLKKKLITKNTAAWKSSDGSQKNVDYPTMKVVKVAPKAEFYRSSGLLSLNWLSALKDRTLSQTHSDSNKSVDPSKKAVSTSREDSDHAQIDKSSGKKISVKSILILTLIGAFLCVVFIVFIILTTFPAYYSRKSLSANNLNNSNAVTAYIFDGPQNFDHLSNITADLNDKTWNLDDNFLALYRAEMSKMAARANLSSINFIKDRLTEETPSSTNDEDRSYEQYVDNSTIVEE
uniref:D-2-hydroxyglutarate dehydrogenase, mitochondrial n=1 Tax=Romanomermis culicivorax TaxID=13658 RepID=A0A915JH90_ROMCU